MKQRSLPGFGAHGHVHGHVSVFRNENEPEKPHTATLTVSGVVVYRINGATEREALNALALLVRDVASAVATVCTLGKW